MTRIHRKLFPAPFLLVLFVWTLSLPPAAQAADHSPAPPPAMNLGHGAGGDFIVARVNDAPITWRALESTMREVATRNYGRKDITPALAKRIEEESLDQLITEELAVQRAKSLGITASSDEIEAHIARMEKQWNGAKHFQQYMKLRKWNSRDVWNMAERTVLVKKALEKEAYGAIKIDDRKIRELYEKNRESFIEPEAVQITDIIFFLDPQDPDSMKKAAAVRARVVAELNNDPARLTPDGTFVVQEQVKVNKDENQAIYQQAKKLGKHGLSDPFVNNGTLHVIQLTGYRPRIEKSFEQVKSELKGQLMAGKRKEALRQWLAGLRKGARIEITGQTGKDTK